MRENARQGFWNLWLQVVTAETRGARAKRKLAIDLVQSVRLMFRLAAYGDGASPAPWACGRSPNI